MKGGISLGQEQRPSNSASLRVAISILAFVTVLNVLLPYFVSAPSRLPILTENQETSTAYGQLPHELDITLGSVAMTVEDSINFQLDTEPGTAQWAALLPKGGGYVTLGDGTSRRRFRPAMFHALSCLDTIREGVLERKRDPSIPTAPDVHLCLDYIRQTVQCRSDIQLEQVRSEYGGKSVQPFITHTNCRDWRQVYEEVERLNAQDELGVDQ